MYRYVDIHTNRNTFMIAMLFFYHHSTSLLYSYYCYYHYLRRLYTIATIATVYDAGDGKRIHRTRPTK